MSRTAAVFFDLDGTLIDTAPDMGGALNRLLQRYDRPQVSAERYRPFVSHGSLALLALGFTEPADQDRMAQLREEFLAEYERGVALESQLFAGMEELLQQLERWSIPWGVITNKPEGLTHRLLDALELSPRCCCIIGAETAGHAKPHPAPMHLACEIAAVAADECLYLGDAERDMQAAAASGMRGLIACWGYIGEQDDPHKWQASALLTQPAETLQFVER